MAELFIIASVGFSQGEKGNQGSDGKKGEPGICDLKVYKRIYNSHIIDARELVDMKSVIINTKRTTLRTGGF